MIAPTLPNFGRRVTARARPPLDREISVDSFAGVGGWGAGEEDAIGWAIDVAINHDAYAIANHEINHPATRHYHSDVFEVDPRTVEPGRTIGHGHFSPDCTHHSKARGAAPVSDRVRGLAWIVLAWAFHRRPRVVTMENVEEFMDWGPTLERGGKRYPDAACKGETFLAFLAMLGGGMAIDEHPALDEAMAALDHLHVPRASLVEGLGYDLEHRVLRACDYGAPTIRKRFYLVGRSDGESIIWPEVTHGNAHQNGRRHAQQTDSQGSVSAVSSAGLFDGVHDAGRTERSDLGRDAGCDVRSDDGRGGISGDQEGLVSGVDGDSRSVRGSARSSRHSGRTIRGLKPFRTAAECIDWSIPCPSIFLTPEQAQDLYEAAGIRVRRPLRPATLRRIANGVMRYVVQAARPFIVQCNHAGAEFRGQSIHEPVVPNLVNVQHASSAGVVAAFLSKHYGGVVGGPLDRPIGTITGTDHHSLTAAHLVKLRGTARDGGTLDAPAPTLTSGGNHVGLVAAFLQTYYGNSTAGHPADQPTPTIVGRDRIGLVTVAIDGASYVLADIGMRMLRPHELLRAQFGEFADGWVLTGTQSQQVAGIGNSVCPHVSRAIVTANYQPRVVRQALEAVA